MKQLLARLNDRIAARGSVVVDKDGMLVASDVREGVDVDRLAALGAAIVTEVGRTLRQGGFDQFRQIEIATEQGKVVLLEAGPTYLLVLLGARFEIGAGNLEIWSAASHIQRETEFAA